MLSGVTETHGTVDRVEKSGLESTVIEMPCLRLKTIFEKHQLSHVGSGR